MKRLEKNPVHQTYYTTEGIGPLPGASSVCKLAEETGGLIHWAWQKGVDGEDYREARDAAADSGTVAHGLAETYLLGCGFDELDLSDFTEEALELGEKAFDKFRVWWEQGKYVLLDTELQLVSEKHLFGGTLDILARNPGGKVCLIDLKATKSIRTSHAIQCGGYKLLVDENTPDEPVDEICILRLPKDGGKVEPLWLDPANSRFYERSFLANLAAYYARKALDAVDPVAKKRKLWKPRAPRPKIDMPEEPRLL